MKQSSRAFASIVLFIAFKAICAYIIPSSFTGARVVKKKPSNLGRNNQPIQMFFGEPKDDGSPGDYVCKDCGYVFTKGPKAWAALDKDSYRCPPCGAPKFRFKKVPKGSEKGKVQVKKSWFGN